MITVKERTDFDDIQLDEFTIYDLYTEAMLNKKSPDSSSTASVGNNPMTFCSHYRMAICSITDLVGFVNANVKNNYC